MLVKPKRLLETNASQSRGGDALERLKQEPYRVRDLTVDVNHDETTDSVPWMRRA